MKKTIILGGLPMTIWFLVACAASAKVTGHGNLDEYRITTDNRDRTFLLYAPPGTKKSDKLRPLVLVFHGGAGTARGIAKEVGRKLHPIADREGFFVAYPEAVNKVWDFGAGVVPEALDERIDDRAFFGAMLDDLAASLPIDERRIFATGISRGGMASYFVACTFPERIRAIAAVAMPMPTFMLGMCADISGTGVAVINGTLDPLVPYDGGHIRVGRKIHDEVMSTDATMEFWRRRNECADAPASTVEINPVRDRMRVLRTTWEDCGHGPVLLYRIEGGGHTWPNGSQYLPRFLVGPVNRDIDAATEIWSFFGRFR